MLSQDLLTILQKENHILNIELLKAQVKIAKLEKSKIEAKANEKHNKEELLEKITFLKNSLKKIMEETHELRVQNEFFEWENTQNKVCNNFVVIKIIFII